MLKLSIPATFLNTVASSLSVIALNVRETSVTHKGLKDQEEKSLVKTAEVLGIPVEEYRADKAKRKLAEAEKFVANLPFFSNIKEKVTKVATLTKTNDEVIISINEEYLTECVQAAERVTIKLLKPLADIACIFGDEEENQEAFDAKWFPKKESEPVVESKVVPATDVPEEIRSKVEYHSWTITPSDFVTPEPFYTTEDQESWINIYGLDAVRVSDNQALSVDRIDVRNIMNMKEGTDMQVFAKEIKLPISLIKGIQRYFEYDTVLNHASTTANPKAES